MNCENIQLNLPLYIDDVLSEGERASIEYHLPRCPLCRQKLTEYKENRNEFRMISRPTIPADLLSSVRSAVANELDRPTLSIASEIEQSFTEKLTHWILPYSVGTVAASILTFFMLTALITTTDATNDIVTNNQKPDDSAVLLAKATPKDISKLSPVPEYEQVSVASYPPQVNPSGALMALTKSIVRGNMNDDEVVIVADVFNNGLAKISEVIEPPKTEEAMKDLQKAFEANPENAPFLPIKKINNSDSVRVILKINRVDVVDLRPKKKTSKYK